MDDYRAKGTVTESPEPQLPLSNEVRADTDAATGVTQLVSKTNDAPVQAGAAAGVVTFEVQ